MAPALAEAHGSLAGLAEVRAQTVEDPFMESSSVIVAPDWMREEEGSGAFDTLAEPRAAIMEVIEAVEVEGETDAATNNFRRRHADTDRDITRTVAPGGLQAGETRRAHRRPDSKRMGRTGRIALVIAAGTAIGVGGTAMLRQLRRQHGSELTVHVDEKPAIASPTAEASSSGGASAMASASATERGPTDPVSSPKSASSSLQASRDGGPSGKQSQAAAASPSLTPRPAAPARPTALSAIEVVTAPRGARVLLDGQPPARSPARFDRVPSGRYRLRVSLRGYHPIERTLAVSGGERRTIELDLVAKRGARNRRAGAARPLPQPPASGVLKVRTRPYSEVYLDGRRLGQTPLVTELRPGRYTLVFKQPGKPSQRRSATVRAGEETKLDFMLE
jgi:hypothetical protein